MTEQHLAAAYHYHYGKKEDGDFVGLVREFPSLMWSDVDIKSAIEGIQRLTMQVVDDMVASGEQPPAPDTDPLPDPVAGAMNAFREWRENPPKDGWE